MQLLQTWLMLQAMYMTAVMQQRTHLGLQVVIVDFVVWDRAGVIKDAGLQLVGHVHPWQALHPSKVCNLLVAVVAGQAQSKHAGIIACTQRQHSGLAHLAWTYTCSRILRHDFCFDYTLLVIQHACVLDCGMFVNMPA